MKKIKNLFSQPVNTVSGLYDYSSARAREDTALALIENSALARNRMNMYWKKMRRYYDGLHDTYYEADNFTKGTNIPWNPAQCADGYVHIESQIEPEIPEFEFSPRGRYSHESAKKREETVRYICDANHLADKNPLNERTLGIYGSAVWRIGWGDIDGNGENEVIIDAPSPEEIFPDPTASTVDGCEYIAFVYPMHRQKALRMFKNDLTERNEHFEDYLQSSDHLGFVYENTSSASEDSVTITEFWFRQSCNGKENGITYCAGDIALCVFINGKEIRYIPKYWQNISCSMYPFVIYNKIPVMNSLWGKSELEPIIPIIDAADRELTFAQLNAAFNSNDIIVAEENAFSNGEVPDNSPGSVWKLRPGMMGKVQRLGNMSASEQSQFSNYTVLQAMMEQATGNFEVNQGKEPSRVTTASGIALMNERAKSRQVLKKTGRREGFRRLLTLIDCTALEFYKDGRFIGNADGFDFCFDEYVDKSSGIIPALNIRIHLGDGIANSKAFTVSAISSLIGTNITKENYQLVKAYIDLIGIPMRNEICESLDKAYGGQDLADTLKSLIPTEETTNEHDN